MNIRLIRNTGIGLVVGSLALSSCQDLIYFNTSSCDGVTTTDYLVTDITLSTSNITEFPITLNNALFDFDIEYDTHTRDVVQQRFNFSIIPKAVACSSPMPNSPVAQIQNIEITSNEISLTDNLNSDFQIHSIGSSYYSEITADELSTISEHNLDYDTSNFKLVNQFDGYDTSISTASFHFKITMDDGAIYNLYSDQIQL